MNGYCDKCGKLIINDACVYDLENGKIVGMLCLDCDEERERLKDGDEHSTTNKKTIDAAGQRDHETGDQ